MKTTVTASVVALLLAGTFNSFASNHRHRADPGAVVVDTVLVRPACFVATIVGGALFIVSLPFAATSKSVDSVAHALVVRPAEATFTRPLGELESLEEY